MMIDDSYKYNNNTVFYYYNKISLTIIKAESSVSKRVLACSNQ